MVNKLEQQPQGSFKAGEACVISQLRVARTGLFVVVYLPALRYSMISYTVSLRQFINLRRSAFACKLQVASSKQHTQTNSTILFICTRLSQLSICIKLTTANLYLFIPFEAQNDYIISYFFEYSHQLLIVTMNRLIANCYINSISTVSLLNVNFRREIQTVNAFLSSD